jgi:K+:H+ antiporter subunit KhtU
MRARVEQTPLPGIGAPELAPLATAYVLITVVSGPMLARLPDYAWFKTMVRRRTAVRRTAEPVPASD